MKRLFTYLLIGCFFSTVGFGNFDKKTYLENNGIVVATIPKSGSNLMIVILKEMFGIKPLNTQALKDIATKFDKVKMIVCHRV